jgi:hypothetical protein
MSEKPNYHGFLFKIAPSMDKILNEFTKQEARQDVASHWLVQCIILILKDIKTFYKPFKKINGMDIGNLTTLPVIGGVITGGVSFYQMHEWYWSFLILIGVIVLLLSIMIPFYLKRMLDLYNPYFHLPAYKKFRRNEFDLLNHSIHDKQISYNGLAQFVNGIMTKQRDEIDVVNAITQQYNLEKEYLRKEISLLRDKEEDVIETYKSLIDELEDEIQWYERGIDYLVQLFHEFYIIIHRIGNGKCNFSDLDIIAGFTLYKKEGKILTRIADEGTTGQNPQTIDLKRRHHNPWIRSIVEAAGKETNLFKNEPKEGYFIVSYRMNIGDRNDETWIISLQITPSVNEKGYLLALTDDIIDQRIIFKILHGLCQIIYNNRSAKKEVDGSYGK